MIAAVFWPHSPHALRQLTLLSLKVVSSIALFIMTAIASFAVNVTWKKTVWQGDPAWASTQGSVKAVVTETRARLIYLGASDGSLNLLNAPYPQALPGTTNPSPNQGGHRFWLGPQSRWAWPPPEEWEYSASLDAKVEAGVLTLHHPRINQSYPAITREYAWEGDRLRCTALWPDNGQSYFGLHIVAVNTPFLLTARLEKSKSAPEGLVSAQMVGPAAPLHLPHPSITVEEQHATVRSGIKRVKLGFVPQPLTIERPHSWSLSMQPGPCSNATNDSPDYGYLSQVWVGDATHDVSELEQLTPYLKGDAKGLCSSTIYLAATPPAP